MIMSISSEKTRYLLTLKKETKETLQKEAENQNRSLNNLIETIIEQYLKERA